MRIKKILKITAGMVVFLTLPSLLFFAFLYLKYNEPLPSGEAGVKADLLAEKMLTALNYEAYQNTNYIEFSFKNRHHYKWNKAENTCEVIWKDFKVNLNLSTPQQSEVFVANNLYEGQDRDKLINKALGYFNNDSFWLVAPYKVFDKGTERRLVTTEEGKDALLVTYTSGGSTPGDSYLWHLNDEGLPESFQMWVSIIPIGGLEASWSNWTTCETKAKLPTFHKMLVLGIELENINCK
jgi:hypothetical protein